MNLIKVVFVIIISFYINYNVYAGPVFVSNKSVATEMNTPTGILFNPSGSKMYVTGFSGDNGRIAQYSLSTPFSISSASLDENKNIASVLKRPQEIKFNSDGTKVFVISTKSQDGDIDSIAAWSLAIPYDITSLNVSDDTETPFDNTDPRAVDFNTDGTKMFIVETNLNRIAEYKLSTPYDPNSKDNGVGISITNVTNQRFQGFGFSSDGYKMFLVKADHTANNANNVIEEYDLSVPFNIKTAVINSEVYNSVPVENEESIAGITFNFSQGANKLYYIDFRDGDLAREFDLPCAYGIISCMNPTSDGDDVGSVEAQSSSTKKLIQHTSYPVLNRMEWLRRNKDSVNLTNQNLKLQFSNEILASLSNLLMPSSLTNDNTSSNQSISTNWSYWSEGTISIGKVGDSLSSSAKSINTSAITIGADKKVDKDRIHGFALRFGNDDVKVGKLGSALDMNSLSLTIYETRPTSDNMFMDILLGASAIKTDLINNSGYVSTNGKRNGQQVFSSIKFRETFTKEKINFTPNIKLDLGLTTLSDYIEKGAEGLNLRFGRQNIGTIVSSLGSTIDNTINIHNGILKPKIQLQYNADLSPSSSQVFEYASNGTSYVIENINNSTHNINGSFGFDLITDNGLSITSNYERSQNKGAGHTDAFYFAGKLSSRKDETYTLSLDGIQNFNTKLDYKRSLNGFDITFSSNYNLTSLIPDYGANIEVSTNF